MQLEQKALQTIHRYQMIEQGEPITVGFSGGADSVALLHLLYRWKDRCSIPLKAVHLNHLLREEESVRDQEFARAFCQTYGIPFVAKQIDIKKKAAEDKTSIEETARNYRYAFFQEQAPEGKIATAHTLSDSVETVLFNVTRGTGPEGLLGIPAVRERIIRPLIQVTREEVEEYCSYYHLDFVTDSTNLQQEYHRNKIRQQVLPTLKGINPRLEPSVERMTQLLRQDQVLLESLAEEEKKRLKTPSGYRRQELLQLPPALSSRILRQLLLEHRLDLSHHRVEQMMEGLSQREDVQLSEELFLQVGREVFTIAPRTRTTQQPYQIAFDRWPVSMCIPLLSGRILQIQSVECKETENNKNIHTRRLNFQADYDKIGTYVTVRYRKAGDRFSPLGRGHTKTLKKLFNEVAVPVWERGKLTILEAENEILWLEGFGVSQRVGVTSSSQRIVEFTVNKT